MNTRIKKVRKDEGLTMVQFGDRIGISAASCSLVKTTHPTKR